MCSSPELHGYRVRRYFFDPISSAVRDEIKQRKEKEKKIILERFSTQVHFAVLPEGLNVLIGNILLLTRKARDERKER